MHIFREGSHPDDFSRLTYRKLLEEVCRFANVLKMHGVNKGDRVSIYMPMTLELPIAMLACARIGAVHSIVVSTHFSLHIENISLYLFCKLSIRTVSKSNFFKINFIKKILLKKFSQFFFTFAYIKYHFSKYC